MNTYLYKNNAQSGPFDDDALLGWLRSGALSAEDLVWRPGMPGWEPLRQLFPPPVQPPAESLPTVAPAPAAPRPGGWSTGKRLLVIFGAVALAGALGVALLVAGFFTFYRHSAGVTMRPTTAEDIQRVRPGMTGNVTMRPITTEDIQRVRPGMTENEVMKILDNANEMVSSTLNMGEPVAIWTYQTHGQTNRQPATIGFFDHKVARVVAGEQTMNWLSADFLQAPAEAGDARAQRSMGVFYYHGEGGVAKDPATALQWYRKAAAQGNPAAEFMVGQMNFNGEGGLSRDRPQAKAWFLKAAAHGDEDAKRVLREQYPENTGGGPARTPTDPLEELGGKNR